MRLDCDTRAAPEAVLRRSHNKCVSSIIPGSGLFPLFDDSNGMQYLWHVRRLCESCMLPLRHIGSSLPQRWSARISCISLFAKTGFPCRHQLLQNRARWAQQAKFPLLHTRPRLNGALRLHGRRWRGWLMLDDRDIGIWTFVQIWAHLEDFSSFSLSWHCVAVWRSKITRNTRLQNLPWMFFICLVTLHVWQTFTFPPRPKGYQTPSPALQLSRSGLAKVRTVHTSPSSWARKAFR